VKNTTTNELYTTGDIIKRPKLADTLEIIANEGVNAFYNGSLTDKIINEIQSRDGIITKEDLLEYEVDFREALNIDINNKYTAYTTDAPSSGPILTFIFNILQGI
jgi:gamma-glutamyltranspeptidase/glutathione hydrolase/leukotriene-C4 hydrolase